MKKLINAVFFIGYLLDKKYFFKIYYKNYCFITNITRDLQIGRVNRNGN